VPLFFAKALDVRRHSRRRHVEQEIGAIHPVDVGLHGLKGGRRDLLTAQMPLAIFVKKFDRPTQTIPSHHLACRGFHLMTGKVRATTIRAFFRV